MQNLEFCALVFSMYESGKNGVNYVSFPIRVDFIKSNYGQKITLKTKLHSKTSEMLTVKKQKYTPANPNFTM